MRRLLIEQAGRIPTGRPGLLVDCSAAPSEEMRSQFKDFTGNTGPLGSDGFEQSPLSRFPNGTNFASSSGHCNPLTYWSFLMSEHFPKDTLVVVADGVQANLYRNRSENGDLQLVKTHDLEPTHLLDEGPSGSRPPESSKQETDEATFAKQLARYLYDEASHNRYSSLILAADPQTLGQVRPCLHQIVKERLVKEVDKTFTNSPLEDIERSLS